MIYNIDNLVLYKTAVTPLIMHWSYHSLALNYWYLVWCLHDYICYNWIMCKCHTLGSSMGGVTVDIAQTLAHQDYPCLLWSFPHKHVNSLWPSDAIWQHRSGSTLAQVMAFCLTAPSHYLNQCCWLIISEVLKLPEQQQAWYWLHMTGNMCCCSRVNFIYLGQAKFKIWFKMWIYLW